MPHLAERPMPIMAYSPVGHGRLPRSAGLTAIAKRHGVTTFQVALAWVLRHSKVIAIPKATGTTHIRDNAQATKLALTDEDLAAIDADFPPPSRRTRLAML